MPEGHTIHRLARDHGRAFGGSPVALSSPQGRFGEAALRLNGRILTGVEAYGKHLFYDFGDAALIHVHLGLFGRFVHHGYPPPPPRDTVRLRMSGPAAAADLIGATECTLIDPGGRAAILARLGPDPLRRGSDPMAAWRKLQKRRTPIGTALLDQSVVAGLGNVFRAEILHVYGIHPELPAHALSWEQFQAMWSTLVGWLRDGVRDQVIITVDPREVGKPRSRIAKGEALWVYKQNGCRRCGNPVRRWDLAGRWAYACEICQPPPDLALNGRGR